MEGEGHLSLQVLLAVLLLVLYVIAAPIFEKVHFHYMHESGVVMLLGIAITLTFKFFIPSLDFTTSLAFSDKIFFTFVLPLIIFGAGYNLKKRQFFKYFTYIFLLGVVGTLIAFTWVAPVTYFFNQFNFFYLSYSKYDFPTLIKMGGVPIDPVTKQRLNISELNLTFDKTDNVLNSIQMNFYNNTIPNVRALENEDEQNSENEDKEDNSNEENPENESPENDANNGNNETEEEKPLNESEVDLKKHPILLDFSMMDALSFAAVISATDAVAALTFIHEDSEPKLFSILFGEGVVNDAVCIVIYKILTDFQKSGGQFSVSSVIGMFGTFCSLFGWSFVIGLGMGIVGSLILKSLKKYSIGRQAECALICLFAYLSYILSEELELSPIIALLFNGIFNSHYSFYNLSFQAREESSILSRVLSALAEAFVFVYLGLTAVHYFQVAFSWSFMIFELIVVVCGRFVSVYGICILMDLFHVTNFKLSFVERGICSCSGTIRGAIAFGLSISIVSKSELNRDILLSTTLSLVFISTIVFGALMPYFIAFWKSFDKKKKDVELENKEIGYVDLDDESNEEVRFSYLHPNFDNKIEEFSKEKNLEVLKKRLSYWLGTYWLQFDDAYLKPKLICNWPEVKKEHDEIAEVITDVIKKYLEEKKKKKLYLADKENNNYDNNEDGNEMKEKLYSGDNDNEDEHNEYKTNYQHLRDEEDHNEPTSIKERKNYNDNNY
jgi:NhaP-type Na+/H+ or K+/H+ antiporter